MEPCPSALLFPRTKSKTLTNYNFISPSMEKLFKMTPLLICFTKYHKLLSMYPDL
jgi:hypothetical protein